MNFLTLAVLIALTYLIQRIVLMHALDGLTYDMKSERRTVEPDEPFHLVSTIENNKRMPVFFLHLNETVPADIRLGENEKGIDFRIMKAYGTEPLASMQQVMYIMPRQKAVRRTEVSIAKRGRYILRGATLTAGDLLGIDSRSFQQPLAREIVVFPRRTDISRVKQAYGGYLGDISVRRFIMPDPIDTIGFREYTGTEPQRDISWRETLRRGRLMVKQYDYTAEMRAALIVDVSGASHEEAEQIFSVTRSIADSLEEKHIQFSFVTNAWILSSSSVFGYVPDGTGPVHLNAVLECLGRACYEVTQDTGKMLRDTLKGRNDGRSYIYISADSSRKKDILQYYEAEAGQKLFKVDCTKEVRL